VLCDFTDDGEIAVLTLEDLARRDAMSPKLADAFRARVEELKGRDGLRAVIIRGAGSTFSIGGLRSMLSWLGGPGLSHDDRRDFVLAFYDRWLSMLDLPVPVIAAIEGDCIGVAPVFACVSDVCLVDETANIHLTFTSLGVYPGMALSHLVPRAVGSQAAGLMLLAGQPLTGAEAARAGLAARAVPDGRVHDEALALARQFAANVPDTTATPTGQLRVRRSEIQPVLEFDADQQARSYASPDFRKRIATYLPEIYDDPSRS
jgi:enoyl-CoA hydratase/carnithine racemase